MAGQAAVSNPTAGQMQIDQTSQNAIVNWQGFSIAPNEAVNIHQPNAQAALLNRVVGQDASQIQGQLNANGQVYLVNPNGVLFSKTAQVDVGGLVATTHDITNQDFMNGKAHFTQNGATGTVENHGTIKTPEGGVVALIGEKVSNTGTINTPKGTTALAAGKTIDLDFKGDGLVEVKVSEAALNAQITNQGAIVADGGSVVMTAKAAGQLIDTVINQEGIVKAQGLVQRNGEIILDGGDNGAVKVSGELNTVGWGEARTPASSTTGGNIQITGKTIELSNTANLNSSGNTGGGTITIGDKQTSQTTTIENGATVTAQALNSGTAGTINVLANMDSGTVQVASNNTALSITPDVVPPVTSSVTPPVTSPAPLLVVSQRVPNRYSFEPQLVPLQASTTWAEQNTKPNAKEEIDADEAFLEVNRGINSPDNPFGSLARSNSGKPENANVSP